MILMDVNKISGLINMLMFAQFVIMPYYPVSCMHIMVGQI